MLGRGRGGLALLVVAAACSRGPAGTSTEPTERATEAPADARDTLGVQAGVRAGVLVDAPPDPASPCGPGPGGDPIPFTVLADGAPTGSAVPAAHAAVTAFAASCNALGGIAGRSLEARVAFADTDVAAAVRTACSSDSLALVGTSAVFDSAAAEAALECEMPEVPAATVNPLRGDASLVVAPLPDPVGTFGIGPSRAIARDHPDAVSRAALLFDADHELVARRRAEALQAVGWTVDYQALLDGTEANASAHGAQLRSRNVGALVVDASPATTALVLDRLSRDGTVPGVRLAGPDAYDPALAAVTPGTAGPGRVDGLLVESEVLPTDDAGAVPELRRYTAWLTAVAPGVEPSALGARAWSAALLFATAARAAGAELDRAVLANALLGIDDWDGHGLHAPSSPAANRASDCWLLLRVENGRFLRERPQEGFTCEPDHRYGLTGDYGVGAHPSS